MPFDVKTVLWMLLTGIAIAAVAVIVMRLSLGKFVRKLLETKANTPETAKSTDELGVRGNGYLKAALKGHGPLGTVVKSVSGDPARYYIPEENVSRAESKFRKEKFSLPLILICILLIVGAFIGAIYLWPGLTSLWGRLGPS